MLIACASALFAYYVVFFNLANIGILVSALTGLMLAELIGHGIGINFVLGSMMYQAMIMTTFELESAHEWHNLVTAILIVVLLAIRSRPVTKRREQPCWNVIVSVWHLIKKVFDQFSFRVYDGDFIVIIGSNRAGKKTLFYFIIPILIA